MNSSPWTTPGSLHGVIAMNTAYNPELFTAEIAGEFYLNSLVFWLDRRLARNDVSQLVLQDFMSRLIHRLIDERGIRLGDLILHNQDSFVNTVVLCPAPHLCEP